MCGRTPRLSDEEAQEILEEMARPPEDTPERRATFARARIMEEVRRRSGLDFPDVVLRVKK